MKKVFIPRYEYNGYTNELRYKIHNKDIIFRAYEYLKDKETTETIVNEEEEEVEVIADDLNIKYLFGILYQSISDFAYGFTSEVEEFLQSEYLSNELKGEISIRLSADNPIQKILDSRHINEFSKDELKEIVDFLSSDKKNSRFVETFVEYIFLALEGPGPVEYIKDRFKDDLPMAILKRSNMSMYPSYYSGYGIDKSLLGERHLFSIYKKFVKFYPDKAEDYVDFVNHISNLTASEFVSNYKMFVLNGFDRHFKYKSGNLSLDGVFDAARDLVGAISSFSIFSEKSALERRYEKEEAFTIRSEFNKMVNNYKSQEQSNNDGMRLNRNKKDN